MVRPDKADSLFLSGKTLQPQLSSLSLQWSLKHSSFSPVIFSFSIWLNYYLKVVPRKNMFNSSKMDCSSIINDDCHAQIKIEKVADGKRWIYAWQVPLLQRWKDTNTELNYWTLKRTTGLLVFTHLFGLFNWIYYLKYLTHHWMVNNRQKRIVFAV